MAGDEVRFHPVVAALYDPVQSYFEWVQAPAHREYLAAGLEGRILEIGLGTGAMIPYYEESLTPADDLHGVEPDPGMYRRARQRLSDSSLEMSLVSGDGQGLPYPDDSFDYVVECGVCCSVPSIDAMFAEVARVLKPEGRFRFLDHVRSEGPVGRSQDLLTPLWRRIGGNCHLNRRVEPAIHSCEGLTLVELDRPTIGYWPVRAFARGTAKAAE